MKKLYRKGQVHPSPSPSPSSPSDDFSLNYLPAAILTLAASLSSEDKQVLAYLLSCSSNTPFDFDPSKSSSTKKQPSNFNFNLNINNQQHPPSFSCYCFTCYTSYWARWDSSPNRQLIHEIIDAFEDNLLSQSKKKQGLSRKEKRKNNININSSNIIKGLSLDYDGGNTSCNHIHHHQIDEDVNGSVRVNPDLGRVDSVEEDDGMLCETGEKQGSVRKIVTFIGERIWGSVWG